jgi:glycosyltransferase involved in cell wall biosynthesis
MRLLYLNYGPQSGVTAAVMYHLSRLGQDVRVWDPVAGFLYKRQLGRLKVPNALPFPVVATAAAMLRFRRDWKDLYVHTCFAFDRLTARCERAIAAARPDAVLQNGVLFAPGRMDRVPTYLYCDHTRAIAEAYPALPGLQAPIPFEPGWRRREEAVYRRAAAIFTMSGFVRGSLLRDYGVDPRRVHVVGAGPHVTPVGAAPPVRREKAMLFVGSAFARKGGPEAVEAFRPVRARHPDAELWMAGGEQPLRAPPGVRLLGPRSGEELAPLFARACAFVLPTLREPFGLAFLEAMSFGLPCIGTTVEAVPEIVADGETGLLVPPRDTAALARAMVRLLDDPAAGRAMGEAGRARVAARFSWERAVGRMVEVMGRARPTTSPPPLTAAL